MLVIRTYEPADYDAVWHLHKAALRAVGADAGDGPWEDDLRAIEATYLASGSAFLVGLLDGQIVAMAALRRCKLPRSEALSRTAQGDTGLIVRGRSAAACRVRGWSGRTTTSNAIITHYVLRFTFPPSRPSSAGSETFTLFQTLVICLRIV